MPRLNPRPLLSCALLLLSISIHPSIQPSTLGAQERTGLVQVRVTLDRADWTYELGAPVTFHLTAIRDGHPLNGAEIRYQIGPEMMPPAIERSAKLAGREIVVEGGTMKEPGFLRCIATVTHEGKTYRGLATAGFRPELIRPTIEDPADFERFWEEGKAELARLPQDAQLTLLPDYGTPAVDVYHVSLQNIGAGAIPSRIYGILCVPKAEGRFPALLSVPGAGVRPYRGLTALAERGIITFQIGIHGLPVNLEPGVYEALGRGALAGYPTFNLEDRARYYYRRVYLGCVRANDFLTGHPKWNGKDLAVTGGSQGGALSIITAGLDSRVKGLAAFYPALSDLTGYLHQRAGGWPHMFRASGAASHRTPEKIATAKYYDVANFARRVRVPGLYSWGYNDETCPPTSIYASYNLIPGPKRLLLALETGHSTTPEQTERVNRWLETFLRHGQGEIN
jgi:cephalosporin-C deacetylase-like acetyl esterase